MFESGEDHRRQRLGIRLCIHYTLGIRRMVWDLEIP